MPQPTRAELLDVMERTDQALASMVGRWSNGIPGHVRAEMIRVRRPLLRMLIRAGRLPARRQPG